MKPLLLGALLIATVHGVALAGDEPFAVVDYTKISRTIAKEPAYVGEPLYALFVFGPAGQARMWAVLDRSKPGLPYRDVLYLDLDADGDLTEPGEKLVAKYSERGARAGMAVVMRVKKLAVPGTDIVHTDFLISTVGKLGRRGIWFRMKYRGKTKISGGYGLTGFDTTMWAKSAAKAPVIRPTIRGPLAFATWGVKPVALHRGAKPGLSILVGSRGSGPDTLAVVDEHFLDLTRDRLVLTLICRAEDGRELRTQARATGHC
jgi:hypothetical protein